MLIDMLETVLYGYSYGMYDALGQFFVVFVIVYLFWYVTRIMLWFLEECVRVVLMHFCCEIRFNIVEYF